MTITHRLALILLVLVLTAPIAAAQDAAAPLLMLVNGENVWGYYPTGLAQLTYSGYADRPVLSPDGTRFAYKLIAPVGVQALQSTGGLVSELPSDIEIRDLTTGAVTPVAVQPPDATFNTGEPARAVVRSAPAWSPDGALLAWTENVAPGDVRQLVVYNPASGQTQVVNADLPLQAGFQQTLPIRWGTEGIALKSVTAPPDSTNPQAVVNSILILQPGGTARASAVVQPLDGEFVYDVQWINEQGVEKVGVLYSSGRWDAIDPATGAVAPLVGTPELYSLSAPDGLSVVFGVTSLPGMGTTFTWRVGDIPLPYTGPLEWLTIAPTGDALAYAVQGEAFVWQAGTTEAIYGTNAFDFSVSDMIWSATHWRSR